MKGVERAHIITTLAGILGSLRIYLGTGAYTCPGTCTSCDHWASNGGWGCDNGYWGFGEGYECLPCEDIGCGSQGGSCADYKGCEECGAGWILSEYTQDCDGTYNFKYCVVDDSYTGTTTSSSTSGSTSSTSNSGATQTTKSPQTLTTTNAIEMIETEYAIAIFAENGIEGSVIVVNGNVLAYLNFENFDFSTISDLDGEDCIEHGLYYGIYSDWSHSTYESFIGTEDCGVDKTGYRFDPWLACSSYSDNEYCSNSALAIGTSHEGCVPAQAYLEKDDDNIYTCSEYTFANNPFSCEVGDLSGKYGMLEYDSDTQTFLSISNSAYEMDSYDLSGKSIVFRCGTSRSRAFCAPFEEFSPSSKDATTASYIHSSFATSGNGGSSSSSTSSSSSNNNKQADTVTTDTDTDSSEWEYYRANQTNSHSKIARFDGKSFVKLTYYHTYDISIDVSELAIPGSCGDKLIYRIYDSNDCQTDGDIDADASFYDPTITCNENSQWEGWLCEDTYLCNDADYSYTCEVDGYYRNIDRFYCGPTDLSNKYGSIDISDSTNVYFNRSGFDSLFPPLALLTDMAVVIECESNSVVVACAAFEDLNDNIAYLKELNENEDNTDNSNDNKQSNSSGANENNILGVSNTVAVIIIVLCIGVLVPCVRAFCKRTKNYENEKNVAGNKRNGRGLSNPVAVMLGISKGNKSKSKTADRRNSTTSSHTNRSQRRNSNASGRSHRTNQTNQTHQTHQTNESHQSKKPQFYLTPSNSIGNGPDLGIAGVAGAMGTIAPPSVRSGTGANTRREMSHSRSRSHSRSKSRSSRATNAGAGIAGAAGTTAASVAGAGAASTVIVGACAREHSRSRTHSREPSRSQSRSRSAHSVRGLNQMQHQRIRSSPNRNGILQTPNLNMQINVNSNGTRHERVGTDSMTMAGANALGLASTQRHPNGNNNLPVIPSAYTGHIARTQFYNGTNSLQNMGNASGGASGGAISPNGASSASENMSANATHPQASRKTSRRHSNASQMSLQYAFE